MLRIGHAHDVAARTGVTVLLPNEALACAVDMRGGGPATRETDAVGPDATLGIAHAIVLSGGSVFGLGAADAVATSLSAGKVGLALVPDTPPVPIVPAACLYDLNNDGAKDWGEEPPYAALARKALAGASGETTSGSLGAGYGAMAGKWRGGFGVASATHDGITVTAYMAINAIGSPLMPEGHAFWAWPFERDGEFGGRCPGAISPPPALPADTKGADITATCIGAVTISIPQTRTTLRRIAVMAQDGLARALRPSHAPFDGDTIFALCPQGTALPVSTMAGTNNDTRMTMALGSLAADCVARAVALGCWHAEEGFAPTVRGSIQGNPAL